MKTFRARVGVSILALLIAWVIVQPRDYSLRPLIALGVVAALVVVVVLGAAALLRWADGGVDP